MTVTVEETTVTTATEPELQDDVLSEVLVEEISIDGMCGVY